MSRPYLSSSTMRETSNRDLRCVGKKRVLRAGRPSCFYSHSEESTGFDSVHDGYTKVGGRFNLGHGLPAGRRILIVQEGHEVARPKRRYVQHSTRHVS